MRNKNGSKHGVQGLLPNAYDQLGTGYKPGQDFQPPPNWDTGFEHAGSGFSPDEAAQFSDFFAEIFGRTGGGGAGHAHVKGEDHHAKIVISLEDAWNGATRQISLRVPQVDAKGHVSLGTRTLNVRIPKGVKAGQMVRLAGQGGASLSGSELRAARALPCRRPRFVFEVARRALGSGAGRHHRGRATHAAPFFATSSLKYSGTSRGRGKTDR